MFLLVFFASISGKKPPAEYNYKKTASEMVSQGIAYRNNITALLKNEENLKKGPLQKLEKKAQ